MKNGRTNDKEMGGKKNPKRERRKENDDWEIGSISTMSTANSSCDYSMAIWRKEEKKRKEKRKGKCVYQQCITVTRYWPATISIDGFHPFIISLVVIYRTVKLAIYPL
jgi:hypothetical protein